MVNKMSFGPHLRMGAGCQNNQLCDQRTGTVSLTLLTFREGQGQEVESFTRGSCVNQSRLCNDASMQTNRTGPKEMTQVGEPMEVRNVGFREGMHVPHTSAPGISSCLVVPEFYPFIINW